jgi:chitin synthase
VICKELSQVLIHDQISWGTKQDDVIETDLGAVIQDSLSQVDVEMLADAADVNRLYEDSLENLKTRKPVDKKKTKPSVMEMEQAAKDYYASVRTNVCRRLNFSKTEMPIITPFFLFS